MQTNRKYINRVYSPPNAPQVIKPLAYDEKLNMSALLSQTRTKINEIIEALPNNFPVLIDVQESHTNSQVRVWGSVFLDFFEVALDETLSLPIDATGTTTMYVNLLNDRYRPVLQFSPKFMEPNWTTLYAVHLTNGIIDGVVFNDIYAGMHESDPNAHRELFESLRAYAEEQVQRIITNNYARLVVWEYNNEPTIPTSFDLSAYGDYTFVTMLLGDGTGSYYQTEEFPMPIQYCRYTDTYPADLKTNVFNARQLDFEVHADTKILKFSASVAREYRFVYLSLPVVTSIIADSVFTPNMEKPCLYPVKIELVKSKVMTV